MKELLKKITIREYLIIVIMLILLWWARPDIIKTFFSIFKPTIEQKGINDNDNPKDIFEKIGKKATKNQGEIKENLKETNTVIDELMKELKTIGKNWKESEEERLEAIEKYNKTLYKLETALAEKKEFEEKNLKLSRDVDSLSKKISALLLIIKEYDSLKPILIKLNEKVGKLEEQNEKLLALNETLKEIDLNINKNSKIDKKNVVISTTLKGWGKVKRNFKGKTTIRLYVTRLKDNKKIKYKTEVEKDGVTTPKFLDYLEYSGQIIGGKEIEFRYTIWEKEFKGRIHPSKGEGYLFAFKIYNENIGEINIGSTTLYFFKIF